MAHLTQVHNPANATGKPRIVFIHGLDGDVRSTWMSNPKVAATLWPKWLGEDTQCPVWLLGYGAATSRWKGDAMALPRQATAVLECLASEPVLVAGPLVLVGHSLGGLVIKTALKQGMGRDVERHRHVVQSIKGIAFVGTPHFGSRLASIASSLRIVRANPQVSDLAMDDAYLEELNQLFVKLQGDLGIKVRVYSETQPLRLTGLLRWLPLGATVVSPSSSQPHIPGEAGTPVEADHRSICKPEGRTVGIYPSMKAFIGEVEAAVAPQTTTAASGPRPVPSDRFEALPAEERAAEVVHLAFAAHGYVGTGASEVPVCGSLCLTSDDPERLRKTLEQVRAAIAADPLVPAATKARLAKASLREIVQTPIARVAALRQLSTTSFSAYFYYCHKSDFDGMPLEKRTQALLVLPLFHRLCKRNQHIERVNSQVPEVLTLLANARQRVFETYKREPALPAAGSAKFAPLEELASFVVSAACNYLSNRQDASAAEIFESLRTRIRYAENVATGKKHLRDVDPLP
jgi:pimeloyl-ACP methyl ester carboxylesterase